MLQNMNSFFEKIGKHLHLPQISSIMGQKQHEWSYEGECGPQTWGKTFSGALGNHQSPINIETKKAEFNPKFVLENPLSITYDINCCCLIKNTGHTFQVDGHQNNLSRVKGGPVTNEYNFLQFHMHWGDSLEKGSEHLLDGEGFAAELHFVNWNHELYKDPKHASESNKNDGLLVLAAFVKVGKFNEEFDKLAQCIHDIHLKNHHVPVDHIDISRLLPENTSDYWSYVGSLTTPPCSECVQWIVFKDIVEISKEQLAKCHELYHVTKEKLCNEKTSIRYNDRPVCSMGDRILQKSFQ